MARGGFLRLFFQGRARTRRDGVAADSHGGPPAVRDWVEVESEVPQALAEMYADLLRQRGIPTRVEGLGVGRGALGGVPVNARLLVPAPHEAEALALLQVDGQTGDMDDRSER